MSDVVACYGGIAPERIRAYGIAFRGKEVLVG